MASLADVDAYMNDPMAFVQVPVKDYAAMKAVIEAANALHAKMNRGEFASTADEQAGVWQAVEALLDVEGEE